MNLLEITKINSLFLIVRIKKYKKQCDILIMSGSDKMKIIYMHHAERNIGKDHLNPELRQLEDITDIGIQEAELLSKRLENQNITAIVTSPYLRCKHTAEIINKYHNVPIIEDERFNEMNRGEEWKSLLSRNMAAIDDIVNSYNEEDTIICITSGVNFSAFVCYFYGIEPSNSVPWSQAVDISPINFTIGKKMLD